ncbi:MAG: hypothetical protein PVJ63_11300, partial [Thioalkalispiraceae bacterium]
MPIIRKFADLILVRENEYRHVFYFFLVYLLAGCGNAFGRSSTDALFFKRFGIEHLPTMYILLGVSLSLTSVFYAAFADRLKPERFFVILYILLIGILLSNWSIMVFGSTSYIYPVYFLVYEIASEVFLIHAAFYLSQNFNSMQAKRVFPVIMSGTLIGSIIGGTIISQVSTIIGIHNIIILWCVLLGTAIMLIQYWHRTHGTSPFYRPQHKSSRQVQQAISQVTSGVKLLKSSQLLRYSSIALFFMVITFYVLCYSVNRVYTKTFPSEEELTRFFGILTATTSSLALMMQVFLTNKVINRFGAKKVNLFFPLTSIASYTALITNFSFYSALVGSVNKDAIMPAFRNPVRVIFFNAIPENVRGRALSSQIVIVLPLALATCGTLLLFMQQAGDPRYFLAVGVCAAIFYLFYNHKMNNAYLKEILSNLKQRIFIPDASSSELVENLNINSSEFLKKIDHLDSDSLVSFIKILLKSNPDIAIEIILNKTLNTTPATRDQIIKLVAESKTAGLSEYLWQAYQDSDDHLKLTILNALFKLNDPQAISQIPQLLNESSSRLKAAGIIGVFTTENNELIDNALATWSSILDSENINDYFVSLQLIGYLSTDLNDLINHYKTNIIKHIETNDNKLYLETIKALEYWPGNNFNEIQPILESAYAFANSDEKISCIRCCKLLDNPTNNNVIEQAIEDKDTRVCYEAAKLLYAYTQNPNQQFYKWLTEESNGTPRYQYALITVLLKENTIPELFDKIAYKKAQEALDLNEILRILSCAEKTSSAMQITIKALEERIYEYIDLALLAMQGHEHPEDIYIIREGL